MIAPTTAPTPALVAPRVAAGGARERSAVLDALRRGAASRPEIARLTGLGRAVVQQRLAELANAGLVVEAGLKASTGGRPPRQVRFNAEAGHVLVADLGATSIDVALADLAGAVVAHRSEPADIGDRPVPVLGRVEALFDALREEAGAGRGEPWAVGIGVPGPVEFGTGRPVAPPIMPGWDDYPLRERFGARYGAPVWVDNDVNVMALGEYTAGVARGHDNVIFVKIGTGIGAGLVSHGRLHRGSQGSAGDVGHVQVLFDDDSVVCRCGKVGCVEAVCGGAALARQAVALATSGASPLLRLRLEERDALSAQDLADAAGRGDPAAIDLLQRSGRLIGRMLAAAVNMFNPSLIVVGGGVANAGDLLLSGIREVVYGRSLPLATRHLAIRRSLLGDRAGVIGAAAMVLDELFAWDRLDRWIAVGSPVGKPELAWELGTDRALAAARRAAPMP